MFELLASWLNEFGVPMPAATAIAVLGPFIVFGGTAGLVAWRAGRGKSKKD